MQNWRTLWHNNIKSIAKCSCIFCTAAVDKDHKILCYYELQGKILPIVHRLLPCYCECSFLTHWCSLQGTDILSSSPPHPTTFLLHPMFSLSFPSVLHPAGSVPAAVCQEVDWTLSLKWSKLKGTPFLRVIDTPDGCSGVVSSTAPLSSYQAVPGRQSGSGWTGISLVALPCRRLSFVELLLPDRGLSKGLQCSKSGRSGGCAQWGLEEVVGQGEKNGKKGGKEGMKTQCIQKDWGCCQNGDRVRGGFTEEGESWASDQVEGCWRGMSSFTRQVLLEKALTHFQAHWLQWCGDEFTCLKICLVPAPLI